MKKLLIILLLLAVLGCKKDEVKPEVNPLLGKWNLEYTMDSAKTMRIPYYEYQSEQPYLVFSKDAIVRFNTCKLNNLYGSAFCFFVYSYSVDSIKLCYPDNEYSINYKIKDDSLYLFGKYSWGMMHVSCVAFIYYPDYWYCIFSKNISTP